MSRPTSPTAAVAAQPSMRAPRPSDAPDPRVRDVVDKVRAMASRGKFDVLSAMQVIHAAAKAGASWDVVEDAVVELAKGADGIAGTADDIIPAATLSTLRYLMHSGVLRDVVEWAKAVAPRVGSKCWPW